MLQNIRQKISDKIYTNAKSTGTTAGLQFSLEASESDYSSIELDDLRKGAKNDVVDRVLSNNKYFLNTSECNPCEFITYTFKRVIPFHKVFLGIFHSHSSSNWKYPGDCKSSYAILNIFSSTDDSAIRSPHNFSIAIGNRYAGPYCPKLDTRSFPRIFSYTPYRADLVNFIISYYNFIV